MGFASLLISLYSPLTRSLRSPLLATLVAASVLQDHIGFDLNFYMSICSMVYLYGRGIPGCIINASFFLFMINEKRQSSQDENEVRSKRSERNRLGIR